MIYPWQRSVNISQSIRFMSFWNSKNGKIHFSYMAIIVALIAYHIYARRPDIAVVAFTEGTLTFSKTILEKDIANMVSDINKAVGDYPSPQSIHYQMFADSLITFHTVLVKDSTAFTDNGYEAGKVVAQARYAFTYFSDKDANVAQEINTLLPNDLSFELFQQNMSPSQLRLQTEIRMLLAVKVVLRYLMLKTSYNLIICFAKRPEMSSGNWAPKVGESFNAEVFMQTYETSIYENQTMRVDGMPLEVKDGMAIFQKRYNSPGLKKILVEIEDKNLLTGQTEVYKKEFSVRVLE